MSDEQFSVRIVVISVIGVVILGLVTVVSWAFPRPKSELLYLSSQAFQSLQKVRKPASIISLAESTASQQAQHSQMLTIQLPCGAKNNFFKSKAKQIRIMTQVCDLEPQDSEKNKLETRIYNSTNQYEANVFRLADQQLTTEYIYLREGDNVITVEHKRNDHTVSTSKFVVKRVSPTQL